MYILNGCIKIKYVKFLIKHLIVYLRFSNLSTYIYTNIHRYIVSTADCCLPRAFALCRCGDWTLCCCSCWPLTCPGSSSGWTVRNSAPGKLVEQDFRQLDIFRHWFRDPNPSVSSVQFSRVQLFMSPWIAAHQASLFITNSQSLLKLMSVESVMPSNHLILNRPLLLLSSIFPSIRVFSNEPVLWIGWPKYWSFSFSISPSNDYSGLISFRMDLFDLLAVQGTLKSLLQHHNSKASIFWCLAFFIVQLSHPYMTTGRTIALTRWTFVGKVMSLLFNMLSRLVIAFFPRSKSPLIS